MSQLRLQAAMSAVSIRRLSSWAKCSQSPLCSDGQFSYMQQPNLPLKFSLYAMSQAINQPGLQIQARQLLNYHQFTGSATSYAGLGGAWHWWRKMSRHSNGSN